MASLTTRKEAEVRTGRTPDAVAPPPGHSRFPLVDGARALAATSILAFHFGGEINLQSWWGDLMQGLQVGVPLFFVISGFLLYRPFLAADVLGAPRIATIPFLWRRALRIVPLYWFALTVIFLLTARSTERAGGFFSGEPWWVFYAFGQVYSPGSFGGGLQQAWTLCIEVTFYLLLPLYALGAAKLRGRASGMRFEVGLLAVLACGSLIFRVAVVTPANAGYLQRTLPSYFYLFAVGMLLALLSVHGERRSKSRWLRWIGNHSELSWAFAIALFCLQAWVIQGMDRPLLENVTSAVVAGLLLVPAVFDDGRRTPVRWFLGHRATAWVGLVSYGLYLWHPQVLSALANAGITDRFSGIGNFALLSVFFACTAAVAGAAYYAIERPALTLKRRPPPRLRSLWAAVRALRR